jgi:hypothetical protein
MACITRIFATFFQDGPKPNDMMGALDDTVLLNPLRKALLANPLRTGS